MCPVISNKNTHLRGTHMARQEGRHAGVLMKKTGIISNQVNNVKGIGQVI
jgi:hypothetical protein